MAYIRKRVDKKGLPRYSVVYRDEDGRKRSKSAGTTMRAAKALLVRIEVGLADGTWGKKPNPAERTLEKQESENPYFSELCQAYLRAKKGTFRDSTYQDIAQVVKNHLGSFFDGYHVSEIIPSTVQKFLLYLEDDGISPATSAKIYRYLKMVLRYAYSLEVIDRDPTKPVKAPRVERREMDYITPKEIRNLIESADTEIGAMIALSAYAGLRVGEVLGLKRADVDLSKNAITIARTWRNHEVGEPKTKSSFRSVPICPSLRKIITDFLKGHPAPDNGNYLFIDLEEGRDRYHFYSKGFEKALDGAGIKRIRIHDLRHSFASLALLGGVDIKTLQTIMGHSSITVTLDIYAHLYQTSYARASASIERAINIDIERRDSSYGEDEE